MRKLKRLTSIVLTIAIALSLSAMALADDINHVPPVDFGGGSEESVPADVTIHFESNEDQGKIAGKDTIVVSPGSRVPEKNIPAVNPKGDLNLIGWAVKGEEEDGVIDLDKFRVTSSITLVAVYDKEAPAKPVAPVDGSQLLDKVDHKHFMQGYPDGTFRPNGTLKRSEAASVFYSLLLNKDVPLTKEFSDVADSAWYNKPVRTLASLGIINGYEDGTFRPDVTISRAEFISIACKFDALTKGTVTFSDIQSHWARPFIESAATKGWVDGYQDGSFHPDEKITRASVAVITNNVLGRVADQKFVDAHADELLQFTDVKPGDWTYYFVAEAVNSHDHTVKDGVETWTALK